MSGALVGRARPTETTFTAWETVAVHRVEPAGVSLGSLVTHVRLLVDDYAGAFTFYRDVLGLEPTFGDEDSGYADFETGDVTVALFDAAEMTEALDGDTPSTRGRDQVAVVFRVDDVETVGVELRSNGVDLVAPPTDRPEWGIRTIHCRDPDGNLLEFNEPLD